MKIGFCHTGSDHFARNQDRCPPLDWWRPLWATEGHEWHSLLVGHQVAQLVDLPANVIDRSKDVRDVADTKAIIETLDLIITVDTMLANLVGRMGRADWVILGYAPDWRWRLKGLSAWHPTLRLFRQPALGDWGSVRAEIIESLGANGRAV